MALDVSFQQLRAPGQPQSFLGVTRDISETGAFVISESLPEVGTELAVKVGVPMRQEWKLFGRGKVVRVERKKTESGFAIAARFDLKGP